jgi:flagellar assembly protein FliH
LTDFAPLLFADLAAPAAGRADDPAVVRGHAAGYAAGLRAAELELDVLRAELRAESARDAEESRRRLESALGALGAAAGRLDALTAPVLADADRALAESAVELAAAILDHEPAPTSVAAVERALGLAGDLSPRRIRLAPSDLAALAGFDAGSVELVPDTSVPAGDAIVDLPRGEMPRGEIDARLAASLDRARAALTEGSAS